MKGNSLPDRLRAVSLLEKMRNTEGLRIGQHGKKKDSGPGAGISRVDVKKAVGKRGDFVSASDIFNTLSKEKQESLKEWFNERVEDERGKPQRARSARDG